MPTIALTIMDMPEMYELFDLAKNIGADPSAISAKEGARKYYFNVEGKSVYVTPRTIYEHFRDGRAWNLNRLGHNHSYEEEGYYASQTDFAKTNGMTQQQVSRLMAKGYSYEDIERGLHLKIFDHLGNRYKSKAAMAQAYGLSRFVFDKREKAGWDLEQILTTPVDISRRPVKEDKGQEELDR